MPFQVENWWRSRLALDEEWSLALCSWSIDVCDVWPRTPWVDGHVWSESFLSWKPIKALLTPSARGSQSSLLNRCCCWCGQLFLSEPKIWRKNGQSLMRLNAVAQIGTSLKNLGSSLACFRRFIRNLIHAFSSFRFIKLKLVGAKLWTTEGMSKAFDKQNSSIFTFWQRRQIQNGVRILAPL